MKVLNILPDKKGRITELLLVTKPLDSVLLASVQNGKVDSKFCLLIFQHLIEIRVFFYRMNLEKTLYKKTK